MIEEVDIKMLGSRYYVIIDVVLKIIVLLLVFPVWLFFL